ncbi:MAG: ABC transporter substrate-binding protein, partial [Syntrophomonadaceae bacterium]|nr:ABC transporter substrate-binding protein [Syntrophomonadaceae bacterium]
VLASFSIIVLAANQEEVVNFARAESFITLDPHDNHHLSNQIVNKIVYDRLLDMKPDGSIGPSLAHSWELSKDQKSITFHLVEGVKFHNGEPFTSEAVKVTVERLRDNPSLVRAQTFGPDQIEGVEIIDDYTCVLHLKTTFAPVWNELSSIVHILPPKDYGEKGVKAFDHPIGTGPYKFVEYVHDVSYTVEANTDYWDEKYFPRVDKIIYRPILEASTQLAALLTGEVDIIDMVHPDQTAVLEKDPNVVILRDPAWDAWFYEINTKHPILKDVRVRTAIDLATDREYLVEVMGGGAPAYMWSYPGMIGYTPDIKTDYNPELARKILDQTGYTSEELTFTYLVPEGWYPKMTEVAVAIQGMMEEVGITFKVQVTEGAAFQEARAAAKYDIFTTGAAMSDPANATIARIVKDQDHSGYVNEDLNQLLIAASNAVDTEVRQYYYEQAYQIVNAVKVPQLHFFLMETIYAHRDRITDFPFVPYKVADLRTVDTVEKPGPVKK